MSKKLVRVVLFIWFNTILISCEQTSKKLMINDFSKPVVDSMFLDPNKKRLIGFTTSIHRIEGYSNDTIIIKLHGEEASLPIYLKGEIDTIFKGDFYGGILNFSFDPYKATKGSLEVEFGAP